MSESSIKRMFAKADMPLTRIDEILRVLKMDFAELARKVADAQPLRHELTLDQERAVVADRKLLLLAIWRVEPMDLRADHRHLRDRRARMRAPAGPARSPRHHRAAPLNRYRLKVAKGFRWRPDGPGDGLLREHVIDDYYSGGFDGDGELLMLVHGQISPSLATTFVERLQRVGKDFAQQHLTDQKLGPDQKRSYTLVVGMRSWLFAAFRDLKRMPRRPRRLFLNFERTVMRSVILSACLLSASAPMPRSARSRRRSSSPPDRAVWQTWTSKAGIESFFARGRGRPGSAVPSTSTWTRSPRPARKARTTCASWRCSGRRC
jgi:hypothetical protein